MLLSLTDTVNMKLVEVFEAFVMYGHILHLETYLYKFLHGSPPCIVIVKEAYGYALGCGHSDIE